MNILFQGGWSKNRDLPNEKELVDNFCLSFARHLLSEDHHVILTTLGEYDFLIANEIARLCKETGKNPKNYITFYYPKKFPRFQKSEKS